MMHPVGPRSPQTYWVRRVLVIAVAVVLVAGVVWLAFGRGSANGSAGGAASTAAPTTTKLTGVLAAADTVTDSSVESTSDSATPTDSSRTGTASTTTGAPATSGSATAGSATTTKPTASKTTPTAAAKTTTTKPAEAKTTAAVTVTVTRSATTIPAAPKTTTPTTTAPPKPSYDAAGRLLCPASSIRLVGTIWGATAGGQPRVGMKATNIGQQPCQFNASGAAPVYTVSTTAGAHVWSQADCFPSPAYPETRLGVGQQTTDVIVWAGTTSAPGKCAAGDRHPVKAGKYVLTVRLGAFTSAPLPFTLQ